MEQVLPTEPISRFRQSQTEILEMLDRGPVVLTHHGVSAGVLIAVDQYNEMVRLIRRFDDIEIIRKRLNELEHDTATRQSLDELDQNLKLRGLLNA